MTYYITLLTVEFRVWNSDLENELENEKEKVYIKQATFHITLLKVEILVWKSGFELGFEIEVWY